ncbi:hypothetical protein QCA50_002848 [Cerrena zonata]|uniref:Uncharacterized protein n=1 Tax=Cerrena zonata TaxID=2478898 RepID=A0AAW0GKT7_9APHY
MVVLLHTQCSVCLSTSWNSQPPIVIEHSSGLSLAGCADSHPPKTFGEKVKIVVGDKLTDRIVHVSDRIYTDLSLYTDLSVGPSQRGMGSRCLSSTPTSPELEQRGVILVLKEAIQEDKVKMDKWREKDEDGNGANGYV